MAGARFRRSMQAEESRRRSVPLTAAGISCNVLAAYGLLVRADRIHDALDALDRLRNRR
ncbi:hypothetical protein ACHIPZ_06740 [Antrihabitans sp. NCIMB 15449]|uniref:Uncharacterized protein n=2 Tax=Antrihabitans spumae TaxID=3373370 RepID=A0ABW7JIX0_9NOCA